MTYGELHYDIVERLPDGSDLFHRTVRGVVAAAFITDEEISLRPSQNAC